MRQSEPEAGTLYIVPTPLGNLADLSPRSAHLLAHVDVVACEDTRVTRRLLSAANIVPAGTLVPHHDHSSASSTARLTAELRSGKSMALVSDAGTPGCSDPGYELVVAAIGADVEIVSVPGPTAAMAALVGSGLPTDRFMFRGFLPNKPGKRRHALAELDGVRATLIFYESPRRVVAMLSDVAEALGDRRVCVCRELSKLHEEWVRGSASEVAARLAERPKVLGELVVVVEGGQDAPTDDAALQGLVIALLDAGAGAKTIKKALAVHFGVRPKAVYDLILAVQKASSPA